MNRKQKSINARQRRIHATAFALLAIITVLFLPVAIAAIGINPELSLASVALFGVGRVLLDHRGGEGGYIGEEEFQTKVLKGVEEMQQRTQKSKDNVLRLKSVCNELSEKQMRLERKLSTSNPSAHRTPGQVSDGAARFFGGLAVLSGIKRGFISGDSFESVVKDGLNIEIRTALTSSDIPLPTEYNAEVVELVGMYGSARRWGTVFPLGAATVKLPRLKTDTTFGLIAGSGTVAEKSPQTEWVTFTPEKFGGLIRLPSELAQDSVVDVGQFIARYAARQIAYVEDYQFFRSTGAGSGINGSAEGLTKSTITNGKVTQMASTKTKFSDATLQNFRDLRGVPDASALRQGAYYLHPSFEQLLASFNTSGNRPYNPTAQINGIGAQPFMVGPTLDGFPVRWVDVMPAYSTSAAVSTVFALFGDVSFQYLGLRDQMRFDTSLEAGFTTDEILVRALERLTIGLMALGAVGGLETAAS